MIIIKPIASGSDGNSYALKHDGSWLLLEAGVPFSQVRPSIDYKTQDVDGCLISHEHGDHAGHIETYTKRGIDCYCSEGTKEILKRKRAVHTNLLSPDKRQPTKVGPWKFVSFSVPHDARDPVGWLIGAGDNKLLYVTDAEYVEYNFQGLTHIMIECNYTKEKLNENINKGRIKPAFKKRLIENHMGLEDIKLLLRRNDISELKKIYLLHLSRRNSQPERMVEEVQLITGCPTYIAGGAAEWTKKSEKRLES